MSTNHEDNSRFRNKDGSLSAYALACGYIQRRDTAPNVSITLWHEGACYHVRKHDHNTGRRAFWHSTESLTEARRVFRKGVAP